MSRVDLEKTWSTRRLAIILTTAAVALTANRAGMALVEVNVTHVGFPVLRGADAGVGADVVRAGQWAPVIVDLSLLDQASFDGQVRLGQLDLDGDIALDAVDVHLRRETGGSQRVFLYVLPNPAGNRGRYAVELVDDTGAAVRVLAQGEVADQALPPQPPQVIEDDTRLILSISSGAVGRVAALADAARQDASYGYRRPLAVAHLGVADLPEHWIGLDMADMIVWDDARPEALTERQLSALITWARHGGTLLIAASRSAGSIRLTPQLSAILPADPGALRQVENLPAIRRALTGPPAESGTRARRGDNPEWWRQPFPAPIPVVECAVRPEAQSLVPASGDEAPDELESGLVTRRRLGRGHVIFSGVTINDLFSAPASSVEFFENLFHLARADEADAGTQRVSLFPHVVGAVSFARWGTAYLFLAMLFSVGYVLLATVGTWSLLGRRRWRHHSWTAFALVAAGASVLSVFFVNAVRGFGGETLHQISVVDAHAGKPRGYATAFFGIKTGIDKALDFWLPSDPFAEAEPRASRCFLRPLPVAAEGTASTGGFTDPGRYRLQPTSAAIQNVRIRATLKRFEGRWEGPLGGTIEGNIVVRGTNLLEGSFLVNNLGVDLHDCYLLQPALSLSGRFGPRSNAIYAFPLGSLPADGERIDLTGRCYQSPEGETREMVKNRHRLAAAQKEWSAGFSGILSSLGYGAVARSPRVLGHEKNALLLLSAISEHDPIVHAPTAQALWGRWTCSHDRVRRLDLREHLARDSLVLIGFARDAGPVRLFARRGDGEFGPIRPDPAASWTMYRITVPATLLHSGETEDEEAVQ